MEEEEDRLTEEILQRSLATKYQVHWKDVTIQSVECNDGSVKGDNMASTMKAICVNSEIAGDYHSDHFMAKCMPINKHSENMMKKVSYEHLCSVRYN